MPLPRFEYVRAARLEEACALLAQHGDRARVMAGGTDLILHMRLRPDTAPAIVVGLGGIPGLDRASFDPDRGLSIGPLARLADVAAHPDVRRVYPALGEAAAATATVQIRNMGTVAGNVCNASPAADTAPPLLVHDAEVRLVGPAGARRALPLEAFFRGPGKTALEPGELVEELFVPRPAGRSASAYERLSGRSRVDIAAVCAAVHVQLGRDGRCDGARVAIGAVAPVPLLVAAAGDLLRGAAPTPELLAAAGAAAAAAARPISDLRASAPYRRQMVAVLVRRALERALAAAGGSA